MKSLLIARELLWMNRWLWFLLALWPWAMAGLLLIGGLHPALDETEAALAQQAIYGLALVAFTGSSLLGNEQRSRRIVLVLSRAVSRRQYLFALWLTAMLPLVFYLADLAITSGLLHVPGAELARVLGALLLVASVTASLSVLLSLVLPGVIAGVLSMGLGGAPLISRSANRVALGRLLQTLIGGAGGHVGAGLYAAAAVEAVLLAGLIFEAAVRLFERRDLRLKTE